MSMPPPSVDGHRVPGPWTLPSLRRILAKIESLRRVTVPGGQVDVTVRLPDRTVALEFMAVVAGINGGMRCVLKDGQVRFGTFVDVGDHGPVASTPEGFVAGKPMVGKDGRTYLADCQEVDNPVPDTGILCHFSPGAIQRAKIRLSQTYFFARTAATSANEAYGPFLTYDQAHRAALVMAVAEGTSVEAAVAFKAEVADVMPPDEPFSCRPAYSCRAIPVE
jgi:hypothetical protein